eukprot:m.125322 g.125322  ORF g.125322 m.125322 type:complete len:76 (-) comp52205_c2_seq16:380-607(-)
MTNASEQSSGYSNPHIPQLDETGDFAPGESLLMFSIEAREMGRSSASVDDTFQLFLRIDGVPASSMHTNLEDWSA